jgi:hypothetical protein
MNNSWIKRLHDELLRLRGDGPGWGNRPGGMLYVEPTALAALALAASCLPAGMEASRPAARAAAEWLAGLQQRDGALGIAPDLPQPRWTTSLGVLVWSIEGAFPGAREKAVKWLLAREGTTWTPEVAEPFGHDPRIPGWPWVEGTHSWLEPTAMAVLALRRAGQAEHQRTFGADLRPHPAPTGLALLALAGIDDAESTIVERSCRYLETILPTTHAPQSLCFGILALTAWDRRPVAADDWLVAAHDRAARCSNSIAQLAFLLLAAGSASLELLGITGADFLQASDAKEAAP